MGSKRMWCKLKDTESNGVRVLRRVCQSPHPSGHYNIQREWSAFPARQGIAKKSLTDRLGGEIEGFEGHNGGTCRADEGARSYTPETPIGAYQLRRVPPSPRRDFSTSSFRLRVRFPSPQVAT